MAVIQLDCPSCGAYLEVDDKVLFCPYCGEKILIHDEEVNYNIHDEAKIKEAEMKEKIHRDELEYKERKEKRERKHGYIALVIGILFVAGYMGFLFFMDESDDNVYLPVSSKEYVGENCNKVINDLESIGFVNISTRELKDIKLGLLVDEGEVESVSIDGDKKFKEDDAFPPDANVVVEYHTKDK